MASTGEARNIAERLRVRELSKYFYLADATKPSKLEELDPGEDIQVPRHVPAPRPRLAGDATLTALAQLAACKLDCQRAFISLIDDHTQYILAEATPSISLHDATSYDENDQLILGVTSFPLSDGICSLTVGCFTGSCVVKFTEPGNQADSRHVVIQDLAKEGLTRNSPSLSLLPPVLRYYLEVPLLSKTGLVLGSLCVIDSRPRVTSEKSVQILEEIGQLVVEHIGHARTKTDQYRAQRLLESLSHFIRGEDSIAAWSSMQIHQNDISDAPIQGQISVSSEPASAELRNNEYFKPATTTAGDSGVTPDGTPISKAGSSRSNSAQISASPALRVMKPVTRAVLANSDAHTKTGPDLTDAVQIGYDDASPSSLPGDSQASSLNMSKIREAFARASNLLREALDLDATCFLEVPHNERFSRTPAQVTRIRKARSSEKLSESLSESEGSEVNAHATTSQTSGTLLPPRKTQPPCTRLGFSTETKSSLAKSLITKNYLSMPAELLGRLSAKYPDGKIFHFDQQGYISSGDDSGSPVKGQTLTPRTKIGKHMEDELCALFPAAKSLIFCPLFDNQRQQVHSAFLGVSSSPTRVLQSSELLYVSAFTNSVLCEVMRLQSIAVDQAKSDFIASISHELRSPLHGILASTQLLSEGRLYPAQKNFFSMIENCGRTLLDVMEHLLDHAKINNYTQRVLGKRKKSLLSAKKGGKPQTYSRVTEMDIISVVEETVLTMSNHSYRMLEHNFSNSASQTPQSTDNIVQEPTQVPVILRLNTMTSRIFDSEVGSWRRIIMNLLGNSLKYTQHGYVSIELSVTKLADQAGSSVANLVVRDTGQGISEEYLKHRLYTPFAQEDNLTVGAGLGLSMVRQIITSLNGSIDVHSEVGIGTTFEVCIPLRAADTDASRETNAEAETSISKTTNLLKGFRFVFIGFGAPNRNEDRVDSKESDLTSRAWSALRESFHAIFTEWFQLQPGEFSDSSICVVEESALAADIPSYDIPGKVYLVVSLTGKRFNHTLSNARYVDALPPLGPLRLAVLLQQLMGTTDACPTDRLIAEPVPCLDSLRTADTSDTEIAEPATAPPATSYPQGTDSLRIDPVSDDKISTKLDVHEEAILPSSAPTPGVKTILLVDDNDINLRVLTACIKRLKIAGLVYETAANGKQALERYIALRKSGTNVDLVLMDLTMPVMDGFQATRKIRLFEQTSDVAVEKRSRIVALTGLASDEAQDNAKSCGIDQYLRKPVNLNIVRTLVQSMF